MSRLIPALILATSPAWAEDRVPAPDYFVATVMETSTAQLLGVHCPSISVDPVRIAKRTETVLEQLGEDGFTPENLEARMMDPSDAIAVLQDAFMAKHALIDDRSQAAVCAAGKQEIAEDSGIGRLLLEVAQ